ncbi:MAG TPA: biotin/lipoyl-containing protein, partial [Mycoplana sp.]|nr:biotin/lipoyl-containing protein [Mycoplana sp.]
MPINITMPALSPTMEEGNLSKWLVKEGDKIKSGDVIAEIETDKATMEVEAVDEGTVAKIVVPAGTEGVKVNSLIAVLAADGEDVKAAASAAGGAPAPKAEAAPAAVPAPAAKSAPAAAPASPAAVAAPAKTDGARTFSSPLARRLAKEGGIDIAAIAGSGPYGRVVKADVEAAVAGGGARKAAAAPAAAPTAPLAKGPADEAVLKLFEEGSYELVPHDGMRKTIARRLVESKQTVPHFYVSVDCELDALMALRAQINAAAPERDGKPAYKLSVND